MTERLHDYLATAIAWDDAQSNARKANPLFRRLHALYKELRSNDAGRSGIEALMGHPTVGVRLVAASHALGWAPEKATRVLEAIASSSGLHAATAKYTLMAYRSGSLNMDW